METRANYILIGIFTLLSILGTLAFFIWLASFQVNKQYQSYGILFEDVSGLDPSGEVSFNGITVGRVIGLRIAQEDPSKVFTTIEIEADTLAHKDPLHDTEHVCPKQFILAATLLHKLCEYCRAAGLQ